MDIDLIADHCEQVEPDFVASVVLNTSLDLLSCQCEPSLLRALSMADRSALQPVKLVKRALVRHEADKVEHIVVLGGRFSLIVHHEGVLPREAVVSLADFLTIADSMAFVLAW